MNVELHPYGILSLLPTVIAIVLAVLTRRLVLSMLAGIYVGALLTVQFHPFRALADAWEIHLWRTMIDPDRLRVFSFTLLMGALIGVITRSGGMQGLIALVTPWARTRRRGQITAWLMGLIIFFDDYANTLLLGTTLRPITDRLRISREKLAYIVDSTAAPIAGLALISTWVAVEIDYVRSGLLNVDASLEGGAFTLFVQSIPYRFYIWIALFLVPLTALLDRDFSAMWRAEQYRLEHDEIDPRHPHVDSLEDSIRASGWHNAVLPIAVTVGLVIYFIFRTGTQEVGTDATLNEIMGAADPAMALQYGAFGGLALAAFLARLQGLLNGSAILEACASGARVVAPAVLILWLASTISAMTSNKSVDGQMSVGFEFKDHRLYTGDYLKSVLISSNRPAGNADVSGTLNGAVAQNLLASQSKSTPQKGLSTPKADGQNQETGETNAALAEEGSQGPRPVNPEAMTSEISSPGLSSGEPRFPLFLLPTVVFVLAGIVAFCTGTSWGTMGILMPIVVPMAYALVSTVSPNEILSHPLMFASVAGVLSGAIFGDHCSPISDTTVLSSQSCSCDHIAHVTTQMPYALSVAGLNIIFGTLPLGLGVSVWILLPAQLVGVIAILMFFGKRIDVTPTL